MTVLAESQPRRRPAGPDRRPPGQVRLQTLVAIRWIAVAGQLGALLFLAFGLELKLPLAYAVAAVAASALLNIIVFVRYPASTRLSDGEAALFLTYDTLQLAVLVYLTGGTSNPFIVLFLAPVAVAATVLTLRSMLVVAFVAILCLTVVALFHRPLPWTPEPFSLPPMYLVGQWASISVAVAFLTVYLWRISAESRRMQDALVASQLALAREQRISALGGLAAAAAHELGTPLGTIAMAAKEMTIELDPDDPVREDAELILREARRCREILGQIAKRPERITDGYHRLGLADIVREAAAPHQREGVMLTIEAPEAEPVIPRRPEIVHSLTNLIENAVDFARSSVVVRAVANDKEVRIQVLDDGPGLSHDLLSSLGEPYVSSRSEQGEGLGLGVFIAKTLLERTGGQLVISNRRAGGAQFEMVWPREALVVENKELKA